MINLGMRPKVNLRLRMKSGRAVICRHLKRCVAMLTVILLHVYVDNVIVLFVIINPV